MGWSGRSLQSGVSIYSASKPIGFPPLVPESVQHPQMVLTSQDPKVQALPSLTLPLLQQVTMFLPCPEPQFSMP